MAGESFRIEIPVTVTDQTEPGVTQATQKVSAFDKANQKTQDRLDKMNHTKYKVTVETLDKATTVIQKITTSVKGVAGRAWSVTMKVADMATAPLRGIINLLRNPLLQAGAILGVGFSLKDTVDTFSTFEATMSKVKAISGATAGEFDQLTVKAKELGAKTKFTATESAEAFTYMSMAGWNVQQQLEGIDGIMALSAADGLDLATTADIVTDGLTAFGMAAKDSGHFADVLAAASTSANTNVCMLGESFKNVAPIAGALNYSIEDTSVALGLMANAGIKGGQAGTALRNIIKGLGDGVTITGEKLGTFTLATSNADGTMRTFKEQMDDLRTAFSQLTEAERSAAAQNIAGAYGMSGMLAIVNAAEDDYLNLTEAISNADGAAQHMSDIMLDNLAGAFTLLQSAADRVKLSLGERLKPHIIQFTTWFTSKMPDIEVAVGRAMDFVDEKISKAQQTISQFTTSSQWQDADFFGKVKIAWDKLIAEPFDQWWSSTGKAWLSEKAANIGQGLGSGLTTGISTLLGFNVGGAIDDGISVGASFADGFAQGFDGEKVKDVIKGALKGLFSDAATLLPGGDMASSTSLLSTALIGYGLSKTGILGLLGKGGGSLLTSALGGLGGDIAQTAASVMGGGDAMTVNASVVYLNGSIANGGAGQALPAAGAGKAGAGAAAGVSVSTVAGVAGVALGAAGLVSAASDLNHAANSLNEKEKRNYRWSAGAKAGMVGTGALAGAAIGSIVPVVGTALGAAIGAGVGGLGAIFGGSSLGKWFSDLSDGTAKIRESSENLHEARERLELAVRHDSTVSDLVAEYRDLDQAIRDGNGSSEDLAQVQKRMRDITADLAQIYPDLITKYDIERGKLSEKLDLVEQISVAEKQNARLRLQQEIYEGEAILPDVEKKLGQAYADREDFLGQHDIYAQVVADLITYKNEMLELLTNRSDYDTEGYKAYEKELYLLKEKIAEAAAPAGHYSDHWEYSMLESAVNDITKDRNDLLAAANYESDIIAELEDQYSELYEAQRALIEMDLGGTLEDQASKFYDLDKAQQDLFLEALAQVQELERKMGMLPDQKTINIDLITNLMAGSRSGSLSGYEAFASGLIPHASDIEGLTFNAWGGHMTKPHMGIVAEDGPESIIPTSPSKRARGLHLWEETGRILGVTPYAEGGIVGPIAAPSFAQPAAVPSSGTQVSVEVSVNPDFHIDVSQSPEQVKAAIIALLPEITDELAGQIGGALAQIFSNMPIKGAS